MSAGTAPCMTSLCEMMSTSWRVESFSISPSGMTCSSGGISDPGAAPDCGRTLLDLFTMDYTTHTRSRKYWSVLKWMGSSSHASFARLDFPAGQPVPRPSELRVVSCEIGVQIGTRSSELRTRNSEQPSPNWPASADGAVVCCRPSRESARLNAPKHLHLALSISSAANEVPSSSRRLSCLQGVELRQVSTVLAGFANTELESSVFAKPAR